MLNLKPDCGDVKKCRAINLLQIPTNDSCEEEYQKRGFSHKTISKKIKKLQIFHFSGGKFDLIQPRNNNIFADLRNQEERTYRPQEKENYCPLA